MRAMLSPTSVFDRAEWAEFLGLHGFDIDNVFLIDLPDEQMTVYTYREDEDGKHFLSEGRVAAHDPVTVTPKGPIPLWS